MENKIILPNETFTYNGDLIEPVEMFLDSEVMPDKSVVQSLRIVFRPKIESDEALLELVKITSSIQALGKAYSFSYHIDTDYTLKGSLYDTSYYNKPAQQCSKKILGVDIEWDKNLDMFYVPTKYGMYVLRKKVKTIADTYELAMGYIYSEKLKDETVRFEHILKEDRKGYGLIDIEKECKYDYAIDENGVKHIIK